MAEPEPVLDRQTIPSCPICQGLLVTVYSRFKQIVAICED